MQAAAGRAKGIRAISAKIAALLDRGPPGACGTIVTTRGIGNLTASLHFHDKKVRIGMICRRKKTCGLGKINRI